MRLDATVGRDNPGSSPPAHLLSPGSRTRGRAMGCEGGCSVSASTSTRQRAGTILHPGGLQRVKAIVAVALDLDRGVDAGAAHLLQVEAVGIIGADAVGAPGDKEMAAILVELAVELGVHENAHRIVG